MSTGACPRAFDTLATMEQKFSPLPNQSGVCPVCHQSVLPQFYFCPNCGNKLHAPPLSTSSTTQAWIYALSIVLPLICFLAISKWPGITYLRSQDEKARRVGIVACTLIVLSTVATIWYAYIWTEEIVQSQVAQINADMSI